MSNLVLSLHDRGARKKAVSLMKIGEAIGIYNRGVCAIWGNGRDEKFYKRVVKIKGEERENKPLATSLSSSDFLNYVDKRKVPKSLRAIFFDPKEIALRTGSLCFFRAPIREDLVKHLPKHIVSRSKNGDYVMQNWDPFGHDSTDDFISLMIDAGIDLPAVTSMNLSGSPEIVSQEEGAEFCRERGIKIFLKDDLDPGMVKGSFTIISISEKGLSLIRDGNIPGSIFSHLLGHEIDFDESIPSKFPQIEFPDLKEYNPSEARKKIIEHIYKTGAKNL